MEGVLEAGHFEEVEKMLRSVVKDESVMKVEDRGRECRINNGAVGDNRHCSSV